MNQNCSLESNCYLWPENGTGGWQVHSTMGNPKWNHLLSQLPIKGSEDPSEVFLIDIGYSTQAQIMSNKETKTWEAYESLPLNWFANQCLIQYGNKIYHVRDAVEELDPVTWTLVRLADLPEVLFRPGR